MSVETKCVSLQPISELKEPTKVQMIIDLHKKMENNRANRILVPSGLKAAIQGCLGYSQPTIRRALNGADDTRIAREIRTYALEHGGAEVPVVRWEKTDARTWVRKH